MSQRSDLAATGLTAAQVAERVAAGQVNDQGRQPTRTAGQILLANIATRFNAILGGLFVVVDLRPGDQVVVDGTVLSSGGPEVDESLLSGEADPVAKQPGGEVLSGSFVVA